MSSLRERNKDVISPNSKIRRGLERELEHYFNKILASWRCPELNYQHLNLFSDHEKLGLEGKGRSIFDGDDDFYLLNKNNVDIINK